MNEFGIFEDASIYGAALTAKEVVSGIARVLAPMRAGTFVAAVIIDDKLSRTDMASLSRTLIECGACYLLFFGPRAEEAHDIADVAREEIPGKLDFAARGDDDVIVTTWSETLEPLEIIFEKWFWRIPRPAI